MPTPTPRTRTQRVLDFLESREVSIRKENKVVALVDPSCSMAMVKVNGKPIMEGNFWDFHPGCHGFDLPSFSDYSSLAAVFVSALTQAKHKVVFEEDRDYAYGDGSGKWKKISPAAAPTTPHKAKGPK